MRRKYFQCLKLTKDYIYKRLNYCKLERNTKHKIKIGKEYEYVKSKGRTRMANKYITTSKLEK